MIMKKVQRLNAGWPKHLGFPIIPPGAAATREYKDKQLNILVTGGAGYIGSIATSELLKAGHETTVYDNLSNGYPEAVPKEAEFISGDLADEHKLKQVLSDGHFDAVMHFAALIEAGESMRVPENFFQNNTANTLTLLRTMLESGVKKF